MRNGVIVYPASEAFSNVTFVSTTVKPTASTPTHNDLVATGLFHYACTQSSTGAVSARLNVRAGSEYKISLFFMETMCAVLAEMLLGSPRFFFYYQKNYLQDQSIQK